MKFCTRGGELALPKGHDRGTGWAPGFPSPVYTASHGSPAASCSPQKHFACFYTWPRWQMRKQGSNTQNAFPRGSSQWRGWDESPAQLSFWNSGEKDLLPLGVRDEVSLSFGGRGVLTGLKTEGKGRVS